MKHTSRIKSPKGSTKQEAKPGLMRRSDLMRKQLLKIVPGLVPVFLLGLEQNALALDMEFYTCNGFGPVSQAFQKIALIFSDGGYIGLFFTVTVLGIMAAGMAFTAKAMTGAKTDVLAWGWPVLFGVVLYLGLFVPKGSITVYDPVLNRFQTIGGIPNAVVFTAGVLNKIERGLVEIIDTAGIPGAKYQEAAGGIGFTAIKEAMQGRSIKNSLMEQSTAKYIEDCVFFELVRPGTTLTADELSYGSTNYLPSLEKAVNPAVYTVFYDAANPQGITMTCTEAWQNHLKPYYQTPGNYANAIKAACGRAGFSPSNIAELQRCQELLTDVVDQVAGVSVTAEDVMRQSTISGILEGVIRSAAPETTIAIQANRQTATTGFGMGIAMNEWLPFMRAIMTSVAIGLIPFLTLFIPTPLFKKALSVMAGFFVFLTTWGITDAIVHGAALDYAVGAFEDIKQSGLGLAACMAFPETSTKSLAMFGIVRSSGLMLASFLSMMLIRFGGHALALMAGNLQGVVQGAGSQAGKLLTPEGEGQAVSGLRQAAIMTDMPNHISHREAMVAGIDQKVHQVGQIQGKNELLAAEKAMGVMSSDTTIRDQGRAEGRHGRIGTDEFMGTIGAGQNGSIIASQGMRGHTESIAASNINNPTQKYAGASTGNYGVALANSINTTKGEDLRKANESMENAGRNFNTQQQAVETSRNGLVSEISRSSSFTDSERKDLSETLSQSASERENLINAISSQSGASKEKAAAAAASLEGAVRAGVTWDSSESLVGKLVSLTSGGSLKTDAGGAYKLSTQDRETYKDVFSSMEREDFTQMAEYLNTRQAALSKAHSIAAANNDTELARAADSYENALADSTTAASSFAQAWSARESLTANWAMAEKNGLTTNVKLDGQFIDWFKATDPNSDYWLTTANSGSVNSHRHVMDAAAQFSQQYADQIRNGEIGRFIQTEGGAMTQGTSNRIEEGRLSQIGPDTVHAGQMISQQDLRNDQGLGNDFSPGSVDTGLGATTMENYESVAQGTTASTREAIIRGKDQTENGTALTENIVAGEQDKSKARRLVESAAREGEGIWDAAKEAGNVLFGDGDTSAYSPGGMVGPVFSNQNGGTQDEHSSEQLNQNEIMQEQEKSAAVKAAVNKERKQNAMKSNLDFLKEDE